MVHTTYFVLVRSRTICHKVPGRNSEGDHPVSDMYFVLLSRIATYCSLTPSTLVVSYAPAQNPGWYSFSVSEFLTYIFYVGSVHKECVSENNMGASSNKQRMGHYHGDGDLVKRLYTS
jgi:hypothetical protein